MLVPWQGWYPSCCSAVYIADDAYVSVSEPFVAGAVSRVVGLHTHRAGPVQS